MDNEEYDVEQETKIIEHLTNTEKNVFIGVGVAGILLLIIIIFIYRYRYDIQLYFNK